MGDSVRSVGHTTLIYGLTCEIQSMRNIVFTLAFLGFLAITLSLGQGVVAPEAMGEVTLPPGEHWSYRIELNLTYHPIFGDVAEIGYRFKVLSGPNVDVFLFTEENYSRYLAGLSAPYEPAFSALDVSSTGGSPYLGPGTYYFVVDNSDYGEAAPESQDVTVEYRIEHPNGGASEDISSDGWILLIGFLVAVAIMIVAAAVVFAILIAKEMRKLN